jgi:hypothetical protein
VRESVRYERVRSGTQEGTQAWLSMGQPPGTLSLCVAEADNLAYWVHHPWKAISAGCLTIAQHWNRSH